MARLSCDYDTGDRASALARIQNYVIPVAIQLKTYLTNYSSMAADIIMHGDDHLSPKQGIDIDAITKYI